MILPSRTHFASNGHGMLGSVSRIHGPGRFQLFFFSTFRHASKEITWQRIASILKAIEWDMEQLCDA